VRVARYLLGRLVRGLVTVLTMIAVVFALYYAIEKQPPVQQFFFGQQAKVTQAQVQAVRHMTYLDASKPRLFVGYVWGLAHGDLGHGRGIDQSGKVFDTGSVNTLYYPALGATLSILLGGAALVVLFSLPLGAISGSRLGSWADRIISFLALLLLCTHPMMLGLVLRSAGSGMHWLPTTGYCPLTGHGALHDIHSGLQTGTCGGPVEWASHLALPWLTFALLFLALYTRMVRASVAETIDEDFVRTARAKGASTVRVLGRHVLPSAGLRVLTMVGMEIGTAIAVSIYIESAFGIDGLGRSAVQVLGGESPSLSLPDSLAIVVLITLIVVVGNLVVDLLYAVLDPRVGVGRAPERTKSLVGGVF
jgi:peptide/nickel transport system permease protein